MRGSDDRRLRPYLGPNPPYYPRIDRRTLPRPDQSGLSIFRPGLGPAISVRVLPCNTDSVPTSALSGIDYGVPPSSEQTRRHVWQNQPVPLARLTVRDGNDPSAGHVGPCKIKPPLKINLRASFSRADTWRTRMSKARSPCRARTGCRSIRSLPGSEATLKLLA